MLPATVLELHVDGIGWVPLPVRPAMAKKLAAAADPAHFGRGEDTLLDVSVRDTGQIDPASVTLGGDQWETDLADAVEQLGEQLGVQDPRRLRVELHSMLVYGKGQFFAPHQDSEKRDTMIATLVVALPSAHSGGELVVTDRGVSKAYAASRSELALVAFYADCHHEVLPVRTGHRITLTFNVLLDEDTRPEQPGPVDQAAALLGEHFRTRIRRPYFDRDEEPPGRLAFLLDHEYSQRGLSANRLKGEDARRAGLLVAAAEAAGYETVLAQTEIQETWNAEPSHWSYGGRYDEDVDDYDDEDVDDVGLSDLIDNSTVLTWWADPESRGEVRLALDDEEVCSATPSVHLAAYHSEYEGFMGNYGNTVDRWYRRAAVVVWPKDRGFSNRAEASPAWALRHILDSVRDGEIVRARAEVMDVAERGLPGGSAMLTPALHVALAVADPSAAGSLLAPFRIEDITEHHVPLLVGAVEQYGREWWVGVVARWDRHGVHARAERREWIETRLSAVIGALGEGGSAAAASVAEALIDRTGTWLAETVGASSGLRHPQQREESLAALAPSTAAVVSVVDEERGAHLVEELTRLGDDVLPLLMSVLRAVGQPLTGPARLLAEHVRGLLKAVLARPERASDDWSIEWTARGGDDERVLEEFLRSPTQQSLAWPLAAPRRRAIHAVIDSVGMPVSHVTIRSGRPFTLMLTKTDTLFAREAEQRRRAGADLKWLESVVTES